MNIPGYKVEQEIGRGGMATVYRAVQESLQRIVAVKVMSAALAAEGGFGERFLREARTAASLNHPGILSIYDVGDVGHNYYLTMEYIPGGDLKQRIQQGIKPAEALSIIKQIAVALGHAHENGFIHRDVKPENILFRRDGTPVLADFGIAKALGSATRMTGTGMSIGTPHYMSPEQVRGKDVGTRSDLYSLGVVLYEALTGELPYDGDDAFAIGIAHINDPIPELPQHIGKIQPLLKKLLAKDPTQRYDSTIELCRSIDELLSGSQLASVAERRADAAEPKKQEQQTVVNPRVNIASPAPQKDVRFVDNGNGTVTDISTGLVWQKENDRKKRTWKKAVEYASALSLGDKNDWRLPTVEELKSLVDTSITPSIDPVFSETKATYYWTVSPYADGSYSAWYVNFSGGSVDFNVKTYSYYVRCVR